MGCLESCQDGKEVSIPKERTTKARKLDAKTVCSILPDTKKREVVTKTPLTLQTSPKRELPNQKKVLVTRMLVEPLKRPSEKRRKRKPKKARTVMTIKLKLEKSEKLEMTRKKEERRRARVMVGELQRRQRLLLSQRRNLLRVLERNLVDRARSRGAIDRSVGRGHILPL